MVENKIYYNTEYRKKIKVLSKFNIFIKDRISKKDVIREIKVKKKNKLVVPIIYFFLDKYFLKFSKSILICEKFNLKIFLKYYMKIFKNQLILEYLFLGVIYFFLIINWIWVNEWNKWASLIDVLEYNFLNIKIMFKYINNNFLSFNKYLFKSYEPLLQDYFFFNCMDNFINLYNINFFNELNIFNFLYCFEDIKLEHDKNFVPQKKWKDIKKVSFNYLNLDILNNYYYLSFFSFGIYEFYINLNKYNIHYITYTFFEYWTHFIIEKNVKKYKKFRNQNKNFKFLFYNLRNLYVRIQKKQFFTLRVKYNLFLSNVDYFIFLKDLTYNFYIRNCDYFFEFASHRKLFLRYNNPTSVNKGWLTIWDYDKLYKKILFIFKNNINSKFNLYKVNKFDSFFNFYYNKKKDNLNEFLNIFFKNLNVKLLYKVNYSNNFLFTINKFFNFNLIDFYNLKNKLESYKNVMSINSVYEYRYANSSFKTMEEFFLTIFRTPVENYIYYNNSYKEFSCNIIFYIYKNIEKKFFFKDFYNCLDNNYLKHYYIFFRFFSRLFNMKIFFFKFFKFFNLIENEEKENLLRFDVFYNFYNIFRKKKIYKLIYKIKKKDFYKRKWSTQKFFNIIKYNSMFYLDIYSIYIYLSGWFYEIAFCYRTSIIAKMYSKAFQNNNIYENYKYIVSFQDFYFQLVYENIEYILIYIFLYGKKIKNNELNYINYINNKNKISNNFIYRRYTLYCWLEHCYYNDFFDDLEYFKKENYSIKLSKWILRYFYKKSELYMYYSESLINRYKNERRLFI